MKDAAEKRACTKCGSTENDFRTRKSKDGTLRPTAWCRTCLNEASRLGMARKASDPAVVEARRAKDAARYERLKGDPDFREKERARSLKYCARPEVKEAAKERSKQWAIANPELARASATRWRKANPERLQEINRQSRERNLEERLGAQLRRNDRRRWQQYNQGSGRFTAMHARLCKAFWDSRCAYCAALVNVKHTSVGRAGFDHVVPLSLGGGHGPENIVVCCRPCNCRKNNRLLSDAVLENLSAQIAVFLAALPPEAEWSAKSAVPTVVLRAVFIAEERVRGRGVPVGTEW